MTEPKLKRIVSDLEQGLLRNKHLLKYHLPCDYKEISDYRKVEDDAKNKVVFIEARLAQLQEQYPEFFI